jgi:hypothetical protein
MYLLKRRYWYPRCPKLGLDVKETAEVLKVSNETVMRDWRLAKVWLLRELRGGKHHGG